MSLPRSNAENDKILTISQATPFQALIGGDAPTAETALHACMVIVVREDHEEGRGALGGGTIVTRNRVITAAHVVRDAISVTVGYYTGSIVPANLRSAEATFWQPFASFDEITLLDDVAVIQFRANTFPELNVIAITSEATVAAATAANLASYGFTTSTGESPSQVPLLAAHTVEAECAEALNATESHICAIATAPTVVCKGDNGSGLFVGTDAAKILIAVVSTLVTDCLTAAPTAFTNLGLPRIQAFLASQGIEPPTA